jgi:hypothetical protein
VIVEIPAFPLLQVVSSLTVNNPEMTRHVNDVHVLSVLSEISKADDSLSMS